MKILSFLAKFLFFIVLEAGKSVKKSDRYDFIL